MSGVAAVPGKKEIVMKSITRRSAIAGIGAAAFTLGHSKKSYAARDYDIGVTDTEIKLGTTSPYSGPASAYGIYGQAQTAYFEMVNDRGGINGRKVNLISLDNAFSPPKAVEQTRKLVESDEVFAIAGFLGTPPKAVPPGDHIPLWRRRYALPFMRQERYRERCPDRWGGASSCRAFAFMRVT